MARMGRWMFALVAVFMLAGAALPAQAQVVVRLGHRHHHHRYYRHHHHYYR